MAFDAVQTERLERELQLATGPGPGVFARAIADGCSRVAALRAAGKAEQIDRLMAAGAWTDAAFALVAAELPGWDVRRLWYDESQWFCTLSQRRTWPVELDDSADAAHEALPLAVLLALLQARRLAAVTIGPAATVPRIQPAADAMLCCDNFA
jgi:hypothetical protein